MNNIKILPNEFVNKNETFTKVFENEKWYIYSRNVSGIIYYEVFKKKIVDCFYFTTKQPTGEKKETYPHNPNNFGVWAWCCRSKERALTYVTD